MKQLIMRFLINILFVLLYMCTSAQISIDSTLYPGLFGSSGAVTTPNSYVPEKLKGYIAVHESIGTDSADRIIFIIGIHPRIEIGLQSSIPSHDPYSLYFSFKFKGNNQGNFYGLKNKIIPATAFGINRNSAYAVSSYSLKKLSFSAGYNFSDRRQYPFFNTSVMPIKFLCLQGEYFNKTTGFSLRLNYKGIIASFFLLSNKNQNLPPSFWSLGTRF